MKKKKKKMKATTKNFKYPPTRSKSHPNFPRKNHMEDAIYDQICTKEGDAAYEVIKIPYKVPEREAKYTPDFLLSNGIIVEVKGYLEVEDRQKHLLIKEQYPYLDIRFIFSNPNTAIRKGSKTTYADWCSEHGFKYATKLIPKTWFSEKTTPERLEELERFNSL